MYCKINLLYYIVTFYFVLVKKTLHNNHENLMIILKIKTKYLKSFLRIILKIKHLDAKKYLC